MNDKPIGQRFTLTYQVQTDLERDSTRARFRVSKLAERSFPPGERVNGKVNFNVKRKAVDALESELGIEFGTRSTTGRLIESWEWFFNRIETRDFLDAVSVLTRTLYRSSPEYKGSNFYKDFRAPFVEEIRRFFKEEHLAYEIDSEGGVHPLIDTAFSSNQGSAIQVLSGDRHKATRGYIEGIDPCLLSDPCDYRGAIRLAFGACENLFKIMYGSHRLDAKTAGEEITKDQQRLYSDHPTLQRSSSKQLSAFKSWIDAAHFYRHEEGVAEPNQPSAEFGVLMISQGISFVRWLAELDKLRNAT